MPGTNTGGKDTNISNEQAKIDQNFKGTLIAVSESGEIKQVKVDDTTQRLLVDAISSETPPSAIAQGRKASTTPGTAVKLITDATTCRKVIITALENNTDIIVIGGSGVLAGTTEDGGNTRTGTPLQMGQAMSIDIDDVSKIYMDVVVSGNGCSFLYLT